MEDAVDAVGPVVSPAITEGASRRVLPTLAERLDKIQSEGLEASKRELDLSDRPIGDEGMQQLARGLAKNSSLRRLLLQRAGLTAAGFAAVGRLLHDGGRAARRRDKAIRERGEGRKPKDEELAGGCADALERLVLSGNDVGPQAIGDDFCVGLSMSLSLRTLALSSCSLGDAGVAPLYEVLGRMDTGTENACLVEHLDLSNNGLTAAAARDLAPALGRNMQLRTLDLKSNQLGPEGAEGIAECMRANKGRVERIDVSQNVMKREGVRTLVERFGMPIRFHVKLSRPRGVLVGMTFGTELLVMGVNPAGVTDTWNQMNPSEAVCPGDKVIRVNDHSDLEDMEELLTSKQELAIELERPGAGLRFLDVCHNEVDLAGAQQIREEMDPPIEPSLLRGGLLTFKDGRQVNMNAF